MGMRYAFTTLTDNQFFIGTKILVYSFLKNNDWFNGDIIVFYDELDQIHIDELNKLYPDIKYIHVNSNKYIEVNYKYNIEKTRFRNVFYKYEVFDLKEYDKVLFVDSDVLILKTLKDLFEYNFCGNIGMVIDYVMNRFKNLSITNNVINENIAGNYCGGGYFVLDNIILSKYNTNDLINSAIEYHEKRINGELINGHVFGEFPEQDVINELFKNNIKTIDIKYNFYQTIFLYDEYKKMNISIEDLYGIHYLTRKKPWCADSNEFRLFQDVWLLYYDEYSKTFNT